MTDEREAPRDDELVRRTLAGDINAFSPLVTEYSAMLSAIAAKHVPMSAVDEVVQDSFVEAFRSLGRYRGPERFRSWLIGILVRRCYRYWRQHRREMPSEDSAIAAALWDRARETFDASTQRHEAARVVQWALSSLNAAERTIVVMHYLDEMPIQKAAEHLNWSVVRAKVTLHRARKRMRKVLEDGQE